MTSNWYQARQTAGWTGRDSTIVMKQRPSLRMVRQVSTKLKARRILHLGHKDEIARKEVNIFIDIRGTPAKITTNHKRTLFLLDTVHKYALPYVSTLVLMCDDAFVDQKRYRSHCRDILCVSGCPSSLDIFPAHLQNNCEQRCSTHYLMASPYHLPSQPRTTTTGGIKRMRVWVHVDHIREEVATWL